MYLELVRVSASSNTFRMIHLRKETRILPLIIPHPIATVPSLPLSLSSISPLDVLRGQNLLKRDISLRIGIEDILFLLGECNPTDSLLFVRIATLDDDREV